MLLSSFLLEIFYKRRKAQTSGWGNSFIGMDEKLNMFESKDLPQIVIDVVIGQTHKCRNFFSHFLIIFLIHFKEFENPATNQNSWNALLAI